MADVGNTIRLFVSSTFADFQRERELLQRRVFPRIAAVCRAEGFRFLPIDLRWGVSEEAGAQQRTLPIIFEELARCQRESPEFHFLALLGDRYGSRLLPSAIPTGDFAALAVAMDDAGRRLLETAYQLDENAVPAEYVLRSRRAAPTVAERTAADAVWHERVAAPLLDAFRAAAPRVGLTLRQALPYTGSVTHQEVQRGLLDTGDPSVALCVFRRFTTPPSGPGAGNYTEDDPTARTLHTAVDEYLATSLSAHPEHDAADLALRYEAGWDEQGPVLDEDALVGVLRAALERRVRAVIARRKASASAVIPAEAANLRFAAERLEHFVGREEPLAAIAAYLAAPAVMPLMVAGPGGMGKSTLIAKAVAEATRTYPQALVLTRFIGVTPGAASLPALLDGLRADLAVAYGQSVEPVRDEWERAATFRATLGWATAERPLILVIDALDQLGPPPLPLDWLPESLPPHVHFIVSLRDEADRPELATLLARSASPFLVPLGRMDAVEGDALLTEWLGEASRTLTVPQRAAVLGAFTHEGRPLYLRLAFEAAQRWRSFERVDAVPPLDPTLPGLLAARFARLERSDEHGPVLTGHTLGLLRAAKNGLAEAELLAMLAQDADVRAEQRILAPYAPPVDPALPLPAALWAMLYADLAAYLTEREADGARLLAFYHRELAEVAAARYLQPPDDCARITALARYFEARPLLEGTEPNRRKLSEQATQEAAGELTAELRHTLTDLGFLEQKIAYLGTASALDDLALAPTDDVLRAIAAAVRLGSHVLGPFPGQIENQLRGRLSEAAIRARLHDAPERHQPWLRLDSPSLAPVGGSLLRTLAGHTHWVRACTFSPDGQTALSASADNTLRLWDVASRREFARFDAERTLLCCAVSPRGGEIVAGDYGGAVHFLSVLGTDWPGGPKQAPAPAAPRAGAADTAGPTPPTPEPSTDLPVAPQVGAADMAVGRRWWLFGRRR
jgi:hypothetical protein